MFCTPNARGTQVREGKELTFASGVVGLKLYARRASPDTRRARLILRVISYVRNVCPFFR